MKYSIALVATLATLAILVGQIESKVDTIIEGIPSEIIGALIRAKKEFVDFSFTRSDPRTNITFNLTSPENLSVDNTSIVNKTLAPSTINVVFDLVMSDLNIEGDVGVQGYYDTVWHSGKFRSLGTYGNLTLKVDAYFNLKSKALIIKNAVKSNSRYVIDFFWFDCDPTESPRDCGVAENRVDNALRNSLSTELNNRVHRILFEATPDIAKRLGLLAAYANLWDVMN